MTQLQTERLMLRRLLAIVDPANERSVALLKRLGLEAAGTLPGENSIACYAIEFPTRPGTAMDPADAGA